MQANWSIVLNVLLLLGVLFAMVKMIRARRQQFDLRRTQPSLGGDEPSNHDDIIAVRKINNPDVRVEPFIAQITEFEDERPAIDSSNKPATAVMMFLLAKKNRQLAGYELLQTLLAAGLRFGEGHLFHRHQFANGQGPVLCSLAAATPSGVFDLQNIGAFSVHGLCLFMEASGNPTIDRERFQLMLDTAKQLSEGLDTYLLDDKRQPLSDSSVQHYYRLLHLDEAAEQLATV